MSKISLQQFSFFLLLVLILVGNYFLKQTVDDDLVEYTGCQLGVETCEIVIGDTRLKVSVEGEVKALQSFFIRIVDKNNTLDQAVVSFKMKAMDMGINQYRLVRVENGWVADIIIPVCTTGRRDWLVEFEFVVNETRRKVAFDIEI